MPEDKCVFMPVRCEPMRPIREVQHSLQIGEYRNCSADDPNPGQGLILKCLGYDRLAIPPIVLESIVRWPIRDGLGTVGLVRDWSKRAGVLLGGG